MEHVIGAAIQQCDDVEELWRSPPTANYLKDLMRQANASLEQPNEAALLRLHAMHRIGWILIEMNLQEGNHKSKLHAATLKLADLNVGKYFSFRCRKKLSGTKALGDSKSSRGQGSFEVLTHCSFAQ